MVYPGVPDTDLLVMTVLGRSIDQQGLDGGFAEIAGDEKADADEKGE